MIEGQGLFNLAAKSAAASTLARQTAAGHHVPLSGSLFAKSEKPGLLGSKDLGSLTVDANTTIRAMFQKAWDKLHEDGNMISDDMLKRLTDASKSDNKEISAERLRQAKAKLRSLRLQAQIAAASGDPKQLRRIAQQAAAAAREVASAARGLAEGIASSAAAAGGDSSGAVPLTAMASNQAATQDSAAKDSGQDSGAQQQTEPEASGTAAPAAVPATAATAGTANTAQTTPLSQDDARDQLRKLGDEARAAIAQARGIIAFAAQAARSKRKHNEPEDDSFRQLQQMVSEAEKDLNSTLNDATTAINNGTPMAGDTGLDLGSISGMDQVSAITTTTIAVQVTTEVTFTASVVV